MSEISFTTRYINGDVPKNFVIIGHHTDPKIISIRNIARVLCQLRDPQELLELMIFTNDGDLPITNKSENIFEEINKSCDNVLRIKQYIDGYVFEQPELLDIKMLLILSHPIMVNNEAENIIQNIMDNDIYGLYNMMAEFTIMMIDHFMIYDNYKKINPNSLAVDQLSSEHVGEVIMLHRYCVEKISQKYNLETPYSAYDRDSYDWSMNLQTKFESEVEKLCKENNISPSDKLHDGSYYNPFTLFKVNVPNCKSYSIPSNLMKQALNSAYNIDKIIAKVDEYYQLCNENTHHFDKKVWLLSILHYVLTTDMPL